MQIEAQQRVNRDPDGTVYVSDAHKGRPVDIAPSEWERMTTERSAQQNDSEPSTTSADPRDLGHIARDALRAQHLPDPEPNGH